MEITDVQVKSVPSAQNKLKAFCTVTFDNSFVVRDVRIIEGTKGLIVAMPAKKFTFKCFKCGCHNPLTARFCSDCGRRVRASNIQKNSQTGRPLYQVDVAHPITQDLRQKLEDTIITKYKETLETLPVAAQPANDDEPRFLARQEGDSDVGQKQAADEQGNTI